jgi:4-hydroxybenzoate polyprenyltransferase
MGTHLLDVLRLYRIHTAMVSAAVPGLVAYMVGGGPFLLIGIIVGSILHHAWGFSFNEIIDLEVDRRNPDLSHKPLVSGRITKQAAGLLSLLALVLSFIFFLIGPLLEGENSMIPLVLLLGATVTGSIYNIYGKKFPLSDVFIALWYALLITAAASSVEGWGPYPVGIWAAVVLGFLHILFNNSVEGGLKDVKNDRRSGARTLAVVCNCRGGEDQLVIPALFLGWGYALRGVFIIAASVFGLLIADRADWGNWIKVVIPLVGLFVFLHGLTFLQARVKLRRKDLIKRFAIHELISFTLCLIVLMPAAGIIPVIVALAAPILWVVMFNRLIFRSTVAPKV